MKRLSLYLLLFCVSFTFVQGDTTQAPNSEEESSQQDEDKEENEEPDEGTDEESAVEEDSFLEPYYESEDSSCGCWDTGVSELLSLLRLITAIDVRYNPNPFEKGGVRSYLGTEGAPIAFSIVTGATETGDGNGFLLDAELFFPCPLGIGVKYEKVRPENTSDFSLFYIEMPFQLLYDLPVSLEVGPHLIYPHETGKWRISGGGIHLGIGYLFLDNLGMSGDYRLSWISGLPFHDAELRFSWYIHPLELWTGWGLLRNCKGEVLHGVRAGVGVSF